MKKHKAMKPLCIGCANVGTRQHMYSINSTKPIQRMRRYNIVNVTVGQNKKVVRIHCLHNMNVCTKNPQQIHPITAK